MTPSTSFPVVLSLQKRWTDVRHVALPPRIFQLRANRDKGGILGSTLQTINGSPNPLNPNEGVLRWFSVHRSSRTAAQGLTVEEKDDDDYSQPGLMEESPRHSEHLNPSTTRDANPPSALPSSAFFPLKQLRGHHDHEARVWRGLGALSQDFNPPNDPDTPQKNSATKDMPQSSETASRPHRAMANIVYADLHNTGRSPSLFKETLNGKAPFGKMSSGSDVNFATCDLAIPLRPPSRQVGAISILGSHQLNDQEPLQRTGTFNDEHDSIQDFSTQWTPPYDRLHTTTSASKGCQCDNHRRVREIRIPDNEHNIVQDTPAQWASPSGGLTGVTTPSVVGQLNDRRQFRKSGESNDEDRIVHNPQAAWIPLHCCPETAVSLSGKDKSKGMGWFQNKSTIDRENDSKRSTTFQIPKSGYPDSTIFPAKKDLPNEEGTQIRASGLQGRNMSPAVPSPHKEAWGGFVTKEKMRQFMRRVPQAPVIVTATNMKEAHFPFRGATVSSFTTVTLEPEVIVSLNLKLPSATFDAIKVSNQFNVNWLKSNERGAQIAHDFAKGRSASPFGDATTQASALAARRQCNVPDAAPPALYPRYGPQDPVAFSIPCNYMAEKTMRIGDHAVIFGVVRRLPETTNDEDAEADKTCLAYIDGHYGHVEPLAKQPQDDFNETDPPPTNNALSSAQPLGLSRRDILAFGKQAMECIGSFETSFLSDAHFVGLQPQTISLVRKLRNQSLYILRAIQLLSTTVNNPNAVSSGHSLLTTQMQRLIAFYFIFCGSPHFRHRSFHHLPESIKKHFDEFQHRARKISLAIKTIQLSLKTSDVPPHPLFALRKAPGRIDQAVPYIRGYAQHFLASEAYAIPSFLPLPRQVTAQFVAYFVRMQLMRTWLGGPGDSLIDTLLDLPSHFLGLIRNRLVLCSKEMLIPSNVLLGVSVLPNRRFRESFFRYTDFCKSLWKPFWHMEVAGPFQTVPAIIHQWQTLDVASPQWRNEKPRSATTNITTMEGTMHEELFKEAEEAGKGKSESKQGVLEPPHSTPQNEDTRDRTVADHGNNSLHKLSELATTEHSKNWTGNAKVPVPHTSTSKKLNKAVPSKKLTLREITSDNPSSSSTGGGHGTSVSHKEAKSSRKLSVSKSRSRSRYVRHAAPVPASGFLQLPTLSKIIKTIKGWSNKRSFSGRAKHSHDSLRRPGTDEPKVLLPISKRSVSEKDSASIPLSNDAEDSTEEKGVAADQSSKDCMANYGIDKTRKNEKAFENVHSFIRPGYVDLPPFRKIWHRAGRNQSSRGNVEKHGTASTAKQENLFAHLHPLIRPRSVYNPTFRKVSRNKSFIRKVETSDQRIQPHEANDEESSSINELLERILIRKHITRDNTSRNLFTRRSINELLERILIRKHFARDNKSRNRFTRRPLVQAKNNDDDSGKQNDDIENLIGALLYGPPPSNKKHPTVKLDEQPDLSPNGIRTIFEPRIRKSLVAKESELRINSPPQGMGRESSWERMTMTTEPVFQQLRESQDAARREAMNKDIDEILGEIEVYFKSRQGKGRG